MKNIAGKRLWLVLVALFLMFGGFVFPVFPGLNPSGMRVLLIFAGVLFLWLFESIEWPSVALLLALAFVPELSLNSIIAGSYGSSTFVFLLFTFVVTYALQQTSFLRKTAYFFINNSLAKKSFNHFMILYFCAILFIGSFISPTVLFFVFYPIMEEILNQLHQDKGSKLASVFMMGTVIMCGISSGMTLIAHVFPTLALGLFEKTYGYSVSYAQYMAIGIPVGLLTACLTTLVFMWMLKDEHIDMPEMHFEEMKPFDGREKAIIALFILTVFLWVSPSIVISLVKNGWINDVFSRINKLGTAFPPMLTSFVLCMIHMDGKPLLSLKDAMGKGVSWPSLTMCAGTLALGAALTNESIGITSWLSSLVAPYIMPLSALGMVFIFALWAAVQTNLSSNMVTATFVTGAALTLAQGKGESFVLCLVIVIGLMASYSFATPPAMPCVAVAVSSGYCKTTDMMKVGFLAMLIGVLAVTLLGYPLMNLIL